MLGRSLLMVDPMVRQSFPPNGSPGLRQPSCTDVGPCYGREDLCSFQEKESRPEPITLTKLINQISLSTISEANQERGVKGPGMGKGTHILQRL